MNKRYILTFLLISLIGIGCAYAQRKYVINVNDFTELSVENNIAVDYFCHPDSAGMVVIDKTANPDLLYFSNNGKGRLAIQSSADCPANATFPHVTVYSTTLYKVINSGDSLVKVFDVPQTKHFSAHLIGNGRLVAHGIEADKVDASIDSGNGQLVISGKCDNANLRNIGKGLIQADGLDAKNVKASILGTGDIGCHASENLTIIGMGSGTVFYRDKPEKIKNRGIGVKFSQL